MSKRRGNTRLARGITTTVPKRQSWQAFDALPRSVREVIWGATVSINPLDAADLVAAGGTDYAARVLRDAIGQEVLRFASEHRQRYGVDLPHLAASASLLSYQHAPSLRARRAASIASWNQRAS